MFALFRDFSAYSLFILLFVCGMFLFWSLMFQFIFLTYYCSVYEFEFFLNVCSKCSNKNNVWKTHVRSRFQCPYYMYYLVTPQPFPLLRPIVCWDLPLSSLANHSPIQRAVDAVTNKTNKAISHRLEDWETAIYCSNTTGHRKAPCSTPITNITNHIRLTQLKRFQRIRMSLIWRPPSW